MTVAWDVRIVLVRPPSRHSGTCCGCANLELETGHGKSRFSVGVRALGNDFGARSRESFLLFRHLVHAHRGSLSPCYL